MTPGLSKNSRCHVWQYVSKLGNYQIRMNYLKRDHEAVDMHNELLHPRVICLVIGKVTLKTHNESFKNMVKDSCKYY